MKVGVYFVRTFNDEVDKAVIQTAAAPFCFSSSYILQYTSAGKITELTTSVETDTSVLRCLRPLRSEAPVLVHLCSCTAVLCVLNNVRLSSLPGFHALINLESS